MTRSAVKTKRPGKKKHFEVTFNQCVVVTQVMARTKKEALLEAEAEMLYSNVVEFKTSAVTVEEIFNEDVPRGVPV